MIGPIFIQFYNNFEFIKIIGYTLDSRQLQEEEEMLPKILLSVLGVGTPGVVLSVLSTQVWQWGFKNTLFVLCLVYTTIYFTYWFCTEFWDNA